MCRDDDSTDTATGASSASNGPVSSAGTNSSPGWSSASSRTTGSTATTGSTQLGGAPLDPGTLSAQIVAGYQDVTTAKGSLKVSSDTTSEDGTFQVAYSGGQPTGLSMSMTIQAKDQTIPLDFVFVDGQLYVHGDELMSQLKTDKHWLLISADSSNPNVAQIAKQVQGVLGSVGTDQYVKLGQASIAAADLGTESRHGQQQHHFQLLADPAKAVAAMSMSATPTAALQQAVPVDMWLDEQQRLVESETTQRVDGSTVTTTYLVTSFDDPVTIAAPDQSDVTSG